MSFKYVDIHVKSLLVKDVNETSITPALLTVKDSSSTLTLTPSSISCNTPFTLSNATFRATTGVTVSTSDNSTNLATTAFVKAQSYLTTASLAAYVTLSSLSEYAKMSIARTWTALQTFSSGIATNLLNATTDTSVMTIGSNLTTGTLTIGTSTSSTTLNGNTTISQFAVPITTNYSYPVSYGKVGFLISNTSTNVSTIANTPVVVVSVSIPPGVWSITGHARVTAGTNTYSSISVTTGTVLDTTKMYHKQPAGSSYDTNINITVFVTNETAGNVTWNLVGQCGFNGTFLENSMIAARIA